MDSVQQNGCMVARIVSYACDGPKLGSLERSPVPQMWYVCMVKFQQVWNYLGHKTVMYTVPPTFPFLLYMYLWEKM